MNKLACRKDSSAKQLTESSSAENSYVRKVVETKDIFTALFSLFDWVYRARVCVTKILYFFVASTPTILD